MLHPHLFVPRPDHGNDAEAVVGGYAFSATLAIQDITGLATSGVSAAHIVKRLEPSAESEAMLFGLVSTQHLRPVTDLGYPELFPEDLDSLDAWLFVSLPLLEDRGVIEANFTFDSELAPLPGEPIPDEPWESALKLLDDLSARLNRPTRQLWVTHAVEADEPPHVRSYGYTPAFREDQGTFSISAIEGLPDAADAQFAVVQGPGFSARRNAAPGELEQFSRLLTSASRDYPRGELVMDTIEWDLERIRDAGARLQDRGGAQLTGLAYVDGVIVGLCEVVRFLADDAKVCELGLVYVLPEHRGRGIGSALLRASLTRAKEIWEDLETVYCSYPADSPAADAIMRGLDAEVVSSTTAWQKP
ncbi:MULTISPECIES: GNAT family N-acetyltransferase [unclassified Corynebacterium]|uniref:GNAT family N-acetyltransferase n=1 Tax=unclassified Corynebacterium TaxID=2624378 RepID=UPI001EF3F848|nr:GNAT family N-acetyltransferase [Corynebacterium sp. ACRPZ]MCG7294971.1 GNAT family N-acetyltransferase [Corynebacterium sp. ACRPY]